MDIQPRNASIELGNIWLSPVMQRTRAATESFFLLMSMVFETLYYRRLTWKCNALNVPSRRAALRMGFSAEGILRNHMIVKGRSRDTIYFSVIEDEYAGLARAVRVWLEAENFDKDGRQIKTLEQIRALAQAPA
jgi:RimJ/RimL family protein N-acetyltransferase